MPALRRGDQVQGCQPYLLVPAPVHTCCQSRCSHEAAAAVLMLRLGVNLTKQLSDKVPPWQLLSVKAVLQA